MEIMECIYSNDSGNVDETGQTGSLETPVSMNITQAAPDNSSPTGPSYYEPVDRVFNGNEIELTQGISAAPTSSDYMALKESRELENTNYQSLLPSDTSNPDQMEEVDDDVLGYTALIREPPSPYQPLQSCTKNEGRS
ncbi:uncharacterized protein LOC114525440 [Dendronephthya gigantea]|uniref:uncharacterized protein LOC114525440 n=1 Tax=Dendronephthya gigantea TaxID=151771 RepID=UPI00106AE1FC|nr:uncharacterized protein LOC114525440 [Dendronephthya gigantea]